MFSFFKSNPIKKLKKQYEEKLTEATNAQRCGDIKKYALLTAESEKIWTQIEVLNNK
jgi:hypothetical protein